jgi:hypothetical protein
MADEFKFPDELEKPTAEEELEVEIIDDTPPEDRNREPLVENPEPDEEELSSYSDRVKKRIGTLQKAYHDERRAKEQADRERQEAVNYASSVMEQNKNLVKRTNTDANLLHETWKSKAEVDLDAAKRKYKDAYESGDADAIIEAQDSLQRATMRHETSLTRQPLQTEEVAVKPNQDVYTAPPPDETATAWATKNSWFGKDRLMTGMAYGVHEDLIARGVHPQRDATKYYDEINREMRKRFPDYSWGDSGVKEPRQKANANVVAPVTRTLSGNKKIALTQTQVALAKRLNIPLQEYAKQVAALNGGNNG